ncbi:MAG: exo-alpha-sialidase, partial [Planctomycetes bacterium]|nr:exo-alpha-sialidase [Planctomycetota bacterium]
MMTIIKKLPLILAFICAALVASSAGQADENRKPVERYRVIFKATQDGYKFCHHSNLVVFQDRLHAMWSNGEVHEDSNGQRILGCSTADGVNWTEPVVIAADPDGPKGPRAAVAAGFHVHGGTLTAFYTSIIGEKQIDPRSTLYAITTRDGKNWGRPRKIATGFYIDGPRRMR